MKIPGYIRQIMSDDRLHLAPGYEHEPYAIGYYFRLYRKNNIQHISSLEAEAARIASWAERNYAESSIVRTVYFSDKEHRKPYYKRDYVLMIITDPVALKLEKEGIQR